MKRFAAQFILLLILTISLPLMGLLLFHKLNSSSQMVNEQEMMLQQISGRIEEQVNGYLYTQQDFVEEHFSELQKHLKIENALSSSEQIPHFAISANGEIINVFYIVNNGHTYKVEQKSDYFKHLFLLAPICIQVYKSGFPDNIIEEINKPPFEFNTDKYSEISLGDISLKLIMLPDAHQKMKEPSILIPQMVIIVTCFIICFILIKYINKIFISPLIHIMNNLKQIKNGNLDVVFITDSTNETIQKTFEILNTMVLGLKEKEKLRENFIQNLSHDLRSPIIAQEAALSILEDEFQGHELFQGMKDNMESYLKMINMIIECFSMKDTDIKILKIELNFTSLVDSIINSLTPLAKEKNINIITEFEPEYFLLYADYISINRIILNLISNAIEHLDRNKEIKIKTIQTEEISKIIIEDNGAGIPQEKLIHIFDKYTSFHKSGKKAISGLGLAITKDLVEKNQGTISIESEVNSYTRFIITLPNKGCENEKI